jgi:hypothetical protein
MTLRIFVENLRYQVFMKVTMKIILFWDLRLYSLADGTNVSEDSAASIFYPEEISSKLLRNVDAYLPNQGCQT